MKIQLTTSSNYYFFDEELVKIFMNKFSSLNPSSKENIDDYGNKYWDVFVDVNSIDDISLIQKNFDEELVIDLRGEYPFVEVYDGYDQFSD